MRGQESRPLLVQLQGILMMRQKMKRKTFYEQTSSARDSLKRPEGRSTLYLLLYTNSLINPDHMLVRYLEPTNLVLSMSSPNR